MVNKHAYLNTLLLLHFAFNAQRDEDGAEREVGCHALNSHGNYIVDHGKIMELCF